MAQNITWPDGTQFAGVPFVNLPKTGGGQARFTDVTPTDAVESDVAQGKTFFKADGSEAVGTNQGGGGGNYTLLAETDITVSTTSTSASSAGTITGITGLADPDAIIYVRIRDKAGKRAGYFYGSDNFFINYQKANGSTSALTYAGRLIHRYSTSGVWAQYVGATTAGYGVYAYSVANNGTLNIYRRYNSSYSLTIDGTYHVEVYKLTFPDGVSPFDA